MQIQPQLTRKWVNPILPSGNGTEQPGGDGSAGGSSTLQKASSPRKGEGEANCKLQFRVRDSFWLVFGYLSACIPYTSKYTYL